MLSIEQIWKGDKLQDVSGMENQGSGSCIFCMADIEAVTALVGLCHHWQMERCGLQKREPKVVSAAWPIKYISNDCNHIRVR